MFPSLHIVLSLREEDIYIRTLLQAYREMLHQRIILSDPFNPRMGGGFQKQCADYCIILANQVPSKKVAKRIRRVEMSGKPIFALVEESLIEPHFIPKPGKVVIGFTTIMDITTAASRIAQGVLGVHPKHQVALSWFLMLCVSPFVLAAIAQAEPD